MSLIRLNDIGKIYVSEGNVSVGIRGVNLSFDIGEFVAITGESGSGKSTLLNVISGMDSYEEGELYIDDEPTSHYIQQDWEEYRHKYISFIFQNYNIIDSFTVLQNVELALMNIDDIKERRKKALELIDRVGMTSHINHKGSKLSGGQKQRTIIARALAKNSKIILADEPTGNLDSKTSKEIIQLLKEVSKDKLLIIVTHNFDEVKDYASRHIRIFDGSVESDHVISEELNKTFIYPENINSENSNTDKLEPNNINKKLNEKIVEIKNGFILGKSIFFSKPRLTIYLCLLMIIAVFGLFSVTGGIGLGAMENFSKTYLFEPIEGRAIVARRDGESLNDSDIKSIIDKCNLESSKYKLEKYLNIDYLLDNNNIEWRFSLPNYYDLSMSNVRIGFDIDYGDNILGRYPEKDNEIFLYLPISQSTTFGTDEIIVKKAYLNTIRYEVVGIKYYYDNNLEPVISFTKDGLEVATMLYYFERMMTRNVLISSKQVNKYEFSFSVDYGKVYVDSKRYPEVNLKDVVINFKSKTINNNYNNKYNNYNDFIVEKNITKEDIVTELEYFDAYKGEGSVVFSPYILLDVFKENVRKNYNQMSLFFKTNRIRDKAVKEIDNEMILCVSADTTINQDAEDALLSMILGIILLFGWIISIIFLGFFVNLCSNKSILAFKGDMAIMRSMGIPTKIIKLGIYVRMLLCVIPAIILLCIGAYLLYSNPNTNELFVYLYPWHYIVIILGVILLIFRITRKQVKNLFGKSVRKSLKGGDH